MHADDLRFLVGDFDTDSAFARHGCDDTNARCGEGEHDVVLEVLDFRHANTGFRHYLIEGYSRSDGCLDRLYLDAIVAKGGNDAGTIGTLFILVDDRHGLVVVHFEEVKRGELEVFEVFARVVGTEFGEDGFRGVVLGEFYGLGVSDLYLLIGGL